jgi:hypothetical protein
VDERAQSVRHDPGRYVAAVIEAGTFERISERLDAQIRSVGAHGPQTQPDLIQIDVIWDLG